MKKMLIAGNWKMNTNQFESRVLAEYIVGGVMKMSRLDIGILMCPPFTSLPVVRSVVDGTNIMVGAQNCHFEPKGAFTGEISLNMIKQLECTHVIIGHSERRAYFYETDELINKKVKAALEAELIPIMCIGETLEQRQGGETFDVLQRQLDGGLNGLDKVDTTKVVIAYEPVWAIGTGISATIEQVQEAHDWIRNYFGNRIGGSEQEMIILYGGSMNDKNAAEILAIGNVNGGLIGGASIVPETFLSIISQAQSIVETA